MDLYIVAIPKDGFGYEWIASFYTAEAAETFSVKFEDAIVVYGVRV